MSNDDPTNFRKLRDDVVAGIALFYFCFICSCRGGIISVQYGKAISGSINRNCQLNQLIY